MGFGAPTLEQTFDLLSLPFMDLEDLMDSLTEKPLLYQPGTKWHYSWSYDVLGYVIEQVRRENVGGGGGGGDGFNRHLLDGCYQESP